MKSITLSSAGLKNIITHDEHKFHFIFGEHDIEMDNILAEFISPEVSRLHKADPTISSINFNDTFNDPLSIFSKKYDDILTSDFVSQLQNISRGYSIEISKEQSFDMQLISILLGNKELFSTLNELYPFDLDESNIDLYVQRLQVFHNFIGCSKYFEYTNIIDFIAQHFYLVDKNELLKNSKTIIYSIISNPKLILDNEDSLFDLINQMYENDDNSDSEISITRFYEEIQFSELSEAKFEEFLSYFKLEEMSNPLWIKLCECFYVKHQNFQKKMYKRYLMGDNQVIEFDGNNAFNGIINHLAEECGGDVSDNNVVSVTASSIYNTYYPKNVVSFNNKNYYFSKGMDYDWLQYDFKERKVRPTHYTIRSRYGFGKSGCHLREWVIEGSNTSLKDDWKVLDLRKGISCLDGSYEYHTFEIQAQLEKYEYFQYLRIRITGPNTGDCDNLTFSDLEYFGSISNNFA